jgi:hypothetical protein
MYRVMNQRTTIVITKRNPYLKKAYPVISFELSERGGRQQGPLPP